MNRFDAWCFHGSTVLVGVTGLIYAWMRYLLKPADPFSIVGHPWQPHVQHLHVWTAPLLVFAVGLIWRGHIWSHWQRGVRSGRASGIAMMLTLVPMVASGYLLQTAVASGWRQVWIVVHVTVSVLWLIGYGAHLWRLRKRLALRNGR